MQRMKRALGGVALLGFCAAAIAAAPPTTTPKPGEGDRPSAAVKVKATKDITNPAETVDVKVWRNGQYRPVKLRVKRTVVTDVNNKITEEVTVPDAVAETKAQLPAVDPNDKRTPPSSVPDGPPPGP